MKEGLPLLRPLKRADLCRFAARAVKRYASTREPLATQARIAHDAAMLMSFLQGLSSGLRVHESPLYRYPYRNAAEAFRGDAKRIADDVEHCMERYRE